MKRRNFLAGMVAGALLLARRWWKRPKRRRGRPSNETERSVMTSVWGNSTLSFEERCKVLARIGFKGVDLPTAQQIPILKANGLSPTLMTGTGTSFQQGLIRKELHDKFEEETRKGIDMCVDLGCPILIALPGERRGMSIRRRRR